MDLILTDHICTIGHTFLHIYIYIYGLVPIPHLVVCYTHDKKVAHWSNPGNQQKPAKHKKKQQKSPPEQQNQQNPGSQRWSSQATGPSSFLSQARKPAKTAKAAKHSKKTTKITGRTAKPANLGLQGCGPTRCSLEALQGSLELPKCLTFSKAL